MTYKKPQESSTERNSTEFVNCNQELKKQQYNHENLDSNGQDNAKEKKSRDDIAQGRRKNSTIRHDVLLTDDVVALSKMFEYVECEKNILDTHIESNIAKFYVGRCVFITGASGFVGKCLLEKLLRSCPDIEQIYILMRPKKGLEVGERVDALLRCELFHRLRKSSNGNSQLKKVMAVKGDITKPLFGLSKIDLDTLSSKVSIVFHSAATVKFAEPLRVAVENNVVSVDNLMSLASNLVNLEALVHVSTAYSNCDRKEVEEIFYETPIEADKLIAMSEWMKPELLDEISPILLGKRPNTYTYTKAVAESLLLERSKKLLPNIPIAMVRPSIVAGIWRQPIPGWVDNFNGPTGIILSMVSGAIQAMLGKSDYCADLVPVDIVANLVICAAWQVHQQQHNVERVRKLSSEKKEYALASKNITIFNCVSGTLNPVKWGDLSKYIYQISVTYPLNTLIRRPGTMLISNEFLYNIFNAINHKFVAHSTDFVMKLAGRKPTLVMIHNRMMKMVKILKPFTTNQWLFECSNVICLYDRLTPIDREIFNFDIRQVRWDDYLRRYYIGSKLFALKDDPNLVVKARHKLSRMAMGSRIIQTVFFLILCYVMFGGSQIERYTVNLIHDTLYAYEEEAPILVQNVT